VGGLAGIAFVLLIIASWFADTTSFEDSDQTAQVIARDLANRVEGLEMSIALVGLATIAGFWFVGSVHLRLTAHGPSTAAWAAFGGGVAMVTLFLAGSAIASASLVGSLAGDPQVAKTLWVLQEGFSGVAAASLLVFMLGVSIVSIKQKDPPRWFGLVRPRRNNRVRSEFCAADRFTRHPRIRVGVGSRRHDDHSPPASG